MPSKKKVIQSAIIEEFSVRPHVKARATKPSVISDALRLEGRYRWKGLVPNEEGELMLHPKHGSGANKLRQAASMQQALKLQERYPKEFWQRHGASAIARKEGIHPSTVRSAKRKLQRNEQAK